MCVYTRGLVIPEGSMENENAETLNEAPKAYVELVGILIFKLIIDRYAPILSPL